MPALDSFNDEIKPAGGSWLLEFFPEIIAWAKTIKFHEYKEHWLIEAEKILRRLRVVSLRLDRISDLLLKKIRTASSRYDSVAVVVPDSKGEKQGQTDGVQGKTELDTLKKDEQRLIFEIAKNPKDAKLYESLGDLYSKMGDFNDAKESYEAAMELNPHNTELQKKHSQALEQAV